MNIGRYFRKVIVLYSLAMLAFFIVNNSLFAADPDFFPNESKLKSGEWYKIRVEEEGVYKITYEDLLSIGISNPSSARVFGNGGRQLSYMNNEYRPNDLLEAPMYIHKGGDGKFGPGDYILFYAFGSTTWKYNSSDKKFTHSKHHYSEYSYYYITSSFGAASEMNIIDESTLASTHDVNSYNYFDCFEENINYYIESGRTWFGKSFKDYAFTHKFDLEGKVANAEIILDYAFAVRSGSSRKVEVSVNGSLIEETATSPVNLDETDHGKQADYESQSITYVDNNAVHEIELSQTASAITDKSHVDYLRVNTRKKLQMDGDYLVFRDIENIGIEKVGTFTINNTDEHVQVWDLSDLDDIRKVQGFVHTGSQFTFRAKTDRIREFIALNVNADFPKPIYNSEEDSLGFISNQNLHAVQPHELVIVTHPLFLEPAEELAQFHREKDNMSVLVVTPNRIYNEFSSGKPDVSAIRNFARMLYLRSENTPDKFKYLLLFGDGSFINHDNSKGNTNYILTYQSEQSVSITGSPGSYVSDDFFGHLDLNEGGGDEQLKNGLLDIGIGRLPVTFTDEDNKEAYGVVNKIKDYYGAGTMRDWRNQICFVGDDGEGELGDGNFFMTDMDEVAEGLKGRFPELNFDKLYLDAYQQISSSSGPRYPDVESEIERLMNKGILVFNYMGHGGENQITQEKVLQKSDLEAIQNGPNYPLFITATCQFGRYDYVQRAEGGFEGIQSAAEAAVLNPKGGAIALFTTSRQVYQNSNKKLNNNIYKYLFSKNENGEKYRLGDIIRLAKNATNPGDGDNKLNFALLGDPALKLAYPEFKVITDSINSIPVDRMPDTLVTQVAETILVDSVPTIVYRNDTVIAVRPDTLSAFGVVTVSGYIAYDDSSIIHDFEGKVYLQVYDKSYKVTTNGNDGIEPFDFELQKNMLFRGKASVTNGRFNITFVVPKDNSYSLKKGKLSFYAENGVIDARGLYDNIVVGGTSDNIEDDYDGPEIELFMNDESFVDGGITSSSPELLVKLFDENGVNTTGLGIGHDLIGTLDFDQSHFILNDYFEAEINNYNKGSIRYPLSNIEEGYHTIDVKVWDIYNNSSEESISFVVKNGDGLVLDKLFNYPNPFNVETRFRYEHNQPGVEHKVRLEVFDMAGRLVHSFTRILEENSSVSEPIYWNGTTSGGNRVPSGIYPYRLVIETPETSPSIISEKLIIISH